MEAYASGYDRTHLYFCEQDNAVGKKTDESPPAKKDSNRALALSLAALGVLFRPTNAVLWVYLGVMHLVQTNNPVRFVMLTVLPIAVITTALMLVIDYVGYGELTFVPLNFIKFNILEVRGLTVWH